MSSIELKGVRYNVQPDETVLEALLRQGANINYSCRKGSCLTCIMQLESGRVQHDKAIDTAVLESGHVLCCVAHSQDDITLTEPDISKISIQAEVMEHRMLTPDVCAVGIAPMKDMQFQVAQHIRLIRDDELARQYSITTLPEENFYFTIHVGRVADGIMSNWICDELKVGDKIRISSAAGDCRYQPEFKQSPLLLVATGTGIGALAGIAREALMSGHAAPIYLYHGVRYRENLYMHDELKALSQKHANFNYLACVTREDPPVGDHHGRVITAIDALPHSLEEFEIFLCGNPQMVSEVRYHAVLKGANRHRVHTDPFEFDHPPMPRDVEKIEQVKADPELWAVLDDGKRITEVLTEFYDQVYVDARLSPFFQGIPKAFVIQKQYEFLANLFTGGNTGYFGLNPYNAHHWMVISDDLFDHRENLFEGVLRKKDYLTEDMIRRWLAVHELFRAEMVKPVARGMIIKGVEQPLKTQEVEILDIDAVCDECGNEIKAGSRVRYIHRLGTLLCSHCANL